MPGTRSGHPFRPAPVPPVPGVPAYVQAGGGIVADSVPENEYQETLNKARSLLRAIKIAETQMGGRE